MGEGTGTFNRLLTFLESAISLFPDNRRGRNRSYRMRDVAMSAFSVFFTQSPSFLSFQRSMQENQGNNNCRTLFGVETIPSDNQIRNVLDGVPSRCLESVYESCVGLLIDEGYLKDFRGVHGQLLVALDGTRFFDSEAINCSGCSATVLSNGATSYYHGVLTAAVVAPGSQRVIALSPEMISPQDGSEKQDCEYVAAKRWMQRWAPMLAAQKVTILGDDLFGHLSFCQTVKEHGFSFIFTCKDASHPSLGEWIGECDPQLDLHETSVRRWDGKRHHTYTYRWATEVPLTDTDHPMLVNWMELTISDDAGKVTYHNTWVTDLPVDETTIEALVQAARTRWKIENETINTLKTKGYHLEHNFGHGKQHLANLLLSLNLLAFLFHTILEFADARYRLIRQTLARRTTFFDDVRALTRYLCFDSWTAMLQFMIAGLKLTDPGG